MAGKVFIASRPTGPHGKWILDFSDAGRYGELVEIIPAGADITKRPDDIAKQLKNRIQELKPSSDDHLILTGNPIILALTAIFWADLCDRINFLQWNKTQQGYMRISLDLS